MSQFNEYVTKPQEIHEHETMLIDLSHVMGTAQGRGVLKYLIKHFGVGDLPAPGLPEDIAKEYIGWLRAGQSIFEIAAQADSAKASMILAEIIKEKNSVTIS